jgi:two-component system sensor histidine kinase MprB
VINAEGEGEYFQLPGWRRPSGSPASGRPFFTEGYIPDASGKRRAHPGVHAADRARARRPDLTAAGGGRPHAAPHRLYLLYHRLGGVAIAARSACSSARRALRPVGQLTEVAEEVAATRDLSRRIETSSRDELGGSRPRSTRCSALDDSVRAQRQLVADASHELRTPLASLRTNIEVLAGGRRCPRRSAEAARRRDRPGRGALDARRRPRRDRPRRRPSEVEDVRLDELVSAAVGRARVRTPRVAFRANLQESVVRGSRTQLDRAVSNLLDNAAKWSDSVDVAVDGRR